MQISEVSSFSLITECFFFEETLMQAGSRVVILLEILKRIEVYKVIISKTSMFH